MNKTFKTRYWTIITYLDSFPDTAIENVCNQLHYARCKYAYIKHDCDVYEKDNPALGVVAGQLKKTHLHWCIEFPTPHMEKFVNCLFGVNKSLPMAYDKTISYRYLLHLDDPDKHRYSLAFVVSNHDVGKCMKLFDYEEQERVFLLDQIVDVALGRLSYYEFYRLHPEWLFKSSSLSTLCYQLQNMKNDEFDKPKNHEFYDVQKYKFQHHFDQWYKFNGLKK